MWRRDPDFWHPLDAHPNIAAIDPHLDSRLVMRDATFTVTATGTVGLEAGLLGLPVATGAPMPWAELGNVAVVPRPDDFTDFVARRGWENLHEDRPVIAEWFAEHYVRHSWKGSVLDPPRYPAVLEPDNVKTLGGAFAEAAASITVP